MENITTEIEILLRAIEWEVEGYHLYYNLACRFTDSIKQEFFHNLANEEGKHRHWLEDRLKEECKGKKISFDKIINAELKNLITLKPLARTPFQNDSQTNHFPDPLTFPISFEFAIGHEYKTIEIYEELLNKVSTGLTARLIQRLIMYEKEHIEFIQAEKARLQLA